MPNLASRKGVEHNKGECPACGRVVAGGVDAETGDLILRRHKIATKDPNHIKSGYATWCSDGRRLTAVNWR